MTCSNAPESTPPPAPVSPPGEVPRELTPIDQVELARVLRDAAQAHNNGVEVPVKMLAVLWAHIAEENARGARIWCHNYGNITAGKSWVFNYFKLPTRPPDPVPSMKFRAYSSHAGGAAGYLDFLEAHYADALDAAEAGDAARFVQRLKARGYFTAPLDPYQRSVVSLAAEFVSKIAGSL